MRIECSLKEKRSQTQTKEWRMGGWWRTRNVRAYAEYETQHPVSGWLCPGFLPALLPRPTGIQSNVRLISYIPFPPNTLQLKMFHGSELSSEQNPKVPMVI